MMTYNVHACKGEDGNVSLERIVAVIQEVNPDVVALQEVDQDRRRSGRVDQAAGIAERLGMEFYFSPAMQWEVGAYGIALMSRLPLRYQAEALLPRPRGLPVEPRCAQLLEIQVEGEPWHLLNTHLGLLPFERMAQIRAILSATWAVQEKPFVACGDFNARPRSPEFALLRQHLECAHPQLAAVPTATTGTPKALRRGPLLLRAGARLARSRIRHRFTDSAWGSTFPTRLPVVRLDYLFHSSELVATSCWVHQSPRARIASDHYPLVAEFRRREA